MFRAMCPRNAGVLTQGTADQLKEQTGGATLEARVADRRDLECVVALLAGLGQGKPRSEPDAGQVSIPAGCSPSPRNQPLSVTVSAVRELLEGGTAAHDAWLSLAWSAGITMVFFLTAYALYQRATAR